MLFDSSVKFNPECKVKLENQNQIMKIMNSRLAELTLEEFGKYMNYSEKNYFRSKIIYNYTKEVPYTLTFTFSKFSWINSGKDFNVRFSASTLLNSPMTSDRTIDQVTKSIKSMSLKNLLNFVKYESGLETNDPVVLRVSNELENYIPEMAQLRSNTSSDEASSKTKIMNFFGKVNAVKEMAINLVIESLKNPVTSKIFISDDVSSIEVTKYFIKISIYA